MRDSTRKYLKMIKYWYGGTEVRSINVGSDKYIDSRTNVVIDRK